MSRCSTLDQSEPFCTPREDSGHPLDGSRASDESLGRRFQAGPLHPRSAVAQCTLIKLMVYHFGADACRCHVQVSHCYQSDDSSLSGR